MSVWVQKLNEICIYIIIYLVTVTNTDRVVMRIYRATYTGPGSNLYRTQANYFAARKDLIASGVFSPSASACGALAKIILGANA